MNLKIDKRSRQTRISMDEIIKIFECLSSNDETIRNRADQAVSQIVENLQVFPILFQILLTPNLPYNIHICASGALRMWFKKNWVNLNQEIKVQYISQLQQILVIGHPCHKLLLHLYKISYPSTIDQNLYFNFLQSITTFIDITSTPEVLISVLSTTVQLIQSISVSLNLSFPNCNPFYHEIQIRTVPLVQLYICLTSPSDCCIIRYCYQIFNSSIYRYLSQPELINLYIEATKSILNTFPIQSLYSNKKYSSLIKVCGKFLQTLMVFNSQHLNSAELSMIILNISLQFLAVLSIHYDIPRMTLINFSRPLNVYVKLLPIDLTLVQILISCSTLTEFEINDFEMNPALFLDYAYCPVPNKKNIRRFCADLSIYLTSLNERFLQILLNQQPSESSMYLMAMIIKPNIPGDYNQQIYNWVISCTQISQTSPIIYSTFLFLISKSYDLLTNDDKQLILQNIINLLRTNNATLFCNALKCFRKLLKEQFVVPNDIIEKIIEFTSICPTNDASKTLQILLKFYPDLTIALSSRIIDAIFSGIIIHYSQESELNEESISKSLEILSEIINEIGSNVITENVINSITFLLSNFNNLIDISDNLCTLISFIFYTNSEYNIILLRNLAQAIQQNEHIMEEMNKFYIPIIIFISAHLNEYVALNCANLFYSIGLNLISMSLKNGSIEMLNAGAELVCWNLQIDNSLDISALLQMIPLIQVDYIKFEIISSVIIFGFFDIVNNEVLNNLLHFLEIIPKCFYEKRLHTVALLKLCIINKGLSDVLIPVASELLLNEKQQRITIGNAKVNFLYCPHEFKAPVEYMDLGNFIKGALENCSDNCRETYKSAFEKCFV